MVQIERMQTGDWERVRSIRLRALRDTPDAFGSTLEREEAQNPQFWYDRLDQTLVATFIAVHEGKDIGISFGAHYEGKEEAAGLFGMWVAPEGRGKGAGEALIRAVTDWSREKGYRRLLLDVADKNPHAIALYERMGFQPTGNHDTLPSPREHILEHERELLL